MSNRKKVVRIIALIIGGLGVFFFAVFIIGEGVPNLMNMDSQLKTMLMLMAFAAFGYFFSFFRAKEGGMVLTFSGILLGLNMFYFGGTEDTIPALIFALPFLIPGIMLWWVGSEKIKS